MMREPRAASTRQGPSGPDDSRVFASSQFEELIEQRTELWLERDELATAARAFRRSIPGIRSKPLDEVDVRGLHLADMLACLSDLKRELRVATAELAKPSTNKGRKSALTRRRVRRHRLPGSRQGTAIVRGRRRKTAVVWGAAIVPVALAASVVVIT